MRSGLGLGVSRGSSPARGGARGPGTGSPGHGQKGVNCFDCHRAEKRDPDAFDHNGNLIAVIVSPKDCGG